MIIEKIQLSNWLSFPDKWEVNGNVCIPALSFDKEPVYLIYGKNGAGKSSIVDAILFALFGEYFRSSGRQEIKNSSAIRSGEKSATLELIFSLNGQRHKVWRNLEGNSSSARYYTWASSKNEWKQELSQVREVNQKIESLLGMPRELFCGTVILEQGKTDLFMMLKPGAQTEYIKDLLGLNIYSDYFERATKLANDRKNRAKEKQKDIEVLADISEEKIALMVVRQQEMQQMLTVLEQEIESLARLYEQIIEVQKRRGQIEKLTSQISECELQIGQRNEIHQAVKIIAEWKQLQPTLREVVQAVKQHKRNQAQFDSLQSQLVGYQNELTVCRNKILTLTPKWESAKHELQKQKENLSSLRAQQPEAQTLLTTISDELKFAKRETDLQAQQRQRQEQLEQFVQVESDYLLCLELDQIGKQLKPIITGLHKADTDLQSAVKVEEHLKDRTVHVDVNRRELQQTLEQITTLQSSLAESQSAERQLRSSLDTNRGALEKRAEAQGQSKCPTCGASLEGTEHDRFHAELLELRQAVKNGENQLSQSSQKTQELDRKIRTLEQERRSLESHITQESSSIKAETAANQQKRQSANESQESAFAEWEVLRGELRLSSAIFISPTEETLSLAREQRKLATYALAEFPRLDQIQRAFESNKNSLQEIQSLRKYPAGTFSQEQFAEVQSRLNNLSNNVQQHEKILADLERSERKVSQDATTEETNQQNLTRQIQKIEMQSLPESQNILTQSDLQVQECRERLDNLLIQFMWSPQQHKWVQQAANDEENQLKKWIAQFEPLAARLEQLQAAEQKIRALQSTLRTIESEITQYSEDAQQTQLKDVEDRLASKRGAKSSQDDEYEALLKRIGQEEDRLRRKGELQQQYTSLLDEENDFRELANLLAPPKGGSSGGPLLRRIIRDSLGKVAEVASDILEEWEQSTEVIVPDDTLEFKIIDRSSSKSERHFQNFSGGEKFMIALAMALAIGEVASNTGHMDCLFIDEGFGSLDTENRALVAQKIVGDLVKTGRRKQIIVITHMTDLQLAFTTHEARYHLVNEGNSTRLMVESDNANSYA